jgi:3-oxoacyl-[acyl-carrier-protein] synthase-3
MIGPFVFGTDGSGSGDLIVEMGGLRQPAKGEGCWLKMDGAAVFNFAMRVVPEVVQNLLARAEITRQEVDYFVPHQANRFMLERLRLRMKIASDRFFSDMRETGNTVSSSIPIALERAISRGSIQEGNRIALLGFGVGLSWGGAMIEIA